MDTDQILKRDYQEIFSKSQFRCLETEKNLIRFEKIIFPAAAKSNVSDVPTVWNDYELQSTLLVLLLVDEK